MRSSTFPEDLHHEIRSEHSVPKVESPNGASMAPDGLWACAGGPRVVLAHLVSSNLLGREAVIVPAIVIGLVVFGVFLRGRARSRWEWRAAWDAYAVREVSRRSIELIPDKESNTILSQ